MTGTVAHQIPHHADAAMDPLPTIILSYRLDRIVAAIDGADAIVVRLLWARPISGRGGDIVLLDEASACVAMLPGLDAIPEPSRTIAREELERRYCIASIVRVHAVVVNFGNCYWDVETDRGRRRFLLRDAGKNLTRVTPDQVLIRDAQGNRYVIASLAALDPASWNEAERAL